MPTAKRMWRRSEFLAAGIALAYALAGFSNFFLRRPFVSDAVLAMVIMATLAAFVIFQFTQQMQSLGTAGAGGLAVGAGGNFDFVRAVDFGGGGAGVFDAAGHDSDAGDLLGDFSGRLMSDYFFGRRAEPGHLVGVGALHASSRTGSFSGSPTRWNRAKAPFNGLMSARRLCYVVGYAGAALAVATALFEERELS